MPNPISHGTFKPQVVVEEKTDNSFTNAVMITDAYFNRVLEPSSKKQYLFGPQQQLQACITEAFRKFDASSEPKRRQMETAIALRSAAIKDAVLSFFMEMLNLGLITELLKTIEELFYETNYDLFLAAGMVPPGWSGKANHFQDGALRWPNGVMIDGKWYPDVENPNYVPGNNPGRYDERLGRKVKPPEWPSHPANKHARSTAPPKITPPKPPTDLTTGAGRTNKLGWRQWLESVWSKIIGKGSLANISKFLKGLGVLGVILGLGQLGLLLYEIEVVDAVYAREIQDCKDTLERYQEWHKKAIQCCVRASECGSNGSGCHRSVTEPPEDGCDSTEA